jgi:hypothetical protein|tara:strand:- start:119 stop:358 length:240 start_codon:yes stop_codon:yes gene_type:complete
VSKKYLEEAFMEFKTAVLDDMDDLSTAEENLARMIFFEGALTPTVIIRRALGSEAGKKIAAELSQEIEEWAADHQGPLQ